MKSLGERLRLRRIESGVSVNLVAEQTKIGARLLIAMEADEFDSLPGGVYRRCFVRQYAHALGFSEEEITAELERFPDDGPTPEEIVAEIEHNAPMRMAGRLSEMLRFNVSGNSRLGRALQRLGAFGGLVAVATLCAEVYGQWERNDRPASAARKIAAATLAQAEKVKATPNAPAVKSTVAVPAATNVPAVQPLVPARANVATAKPPVAATVPDGAPATAHPATQPIEVALRATEQTWVSVTSDGRRSFETALQGGTVRTVAASEMVRVLVGNAGGLELSLNGKPVGPLGSRGQVRIIELTPAGAEIQTAPRKSLPAAEPL